MGKMDDEIKRAGLESLVLEELENHLIFQLQPFEDFRGCALGDRDARGGGNWFEDSQTERGRFFVQARITLMLWLSALSCRAKESGHQIRAVGVFKG